MRKLLWSTACSFLLVGFVISHQGNAKNLQWQDVLARQFVYLYAGGVPLHIAAYAQAIGLSLVGSDQRHIHHDITSSMPLPNNCVDIYQAEDVFEHIEYEKLVAVINEIYRVLKPGGLFRLSIPDYRCDMLYARSLKDGNGNIVFDPGGGGEYVNGKVIKGGHVWFPTIEQVRALLQQTDFFVHGTIKYLHFYEAEGTSITNPIDYSKGYIMRTPDHDKRVQNPYRALSIVVDLYKDK